VLASKVRADRIRVAKFGGRAVYIGAMRLMALAANLILWMMIISVVKPVL